MKTDTKNTWLNSTVIGSSITSFLSDFGHEVVTVFLSSFLIMIGAPVYALGLIEGVSDGLSSSVKLLSGYYSDKIGKRKEFATLGYIATGVFPAIVAVAVSWPVVLFGRAFGWFGRGIRGPPRDTILANSVEKKNLGKAFGFHRAGDTLGAIAGPLAAAYLVTSGFELREIFWLAVIPGLLAILAFWFMVKDKKQASVQSNKSFVLSLKGLPSRFKSFTVAVLIFGIADFSHTLLIFYAVTNLTPSMGFTNAAAIGALLYLIRNIVYALASYPFGVLGDRFGLRRMLAFGYALAVFTFIGFIFAPPNILVYGLLFALAGAFIAAEDALEGAASGELVREKERGLGYGVLATANGMGDFASSIIVSTLWALFGFPAGFVFSAVVATIGTGTLLWANHNAKPN
jgi:MFS family permease